MNIYYLLSKKHKLFSLGNKFEAGRSPNDKRLHGFSPRADLSTPSRLFKISGINEFYPFHSGGQNTGLIVHPGPNSGSIVTQILSSDHSEILCSHTTTFTHNQRVEILLPVLDPRQASVATIDVIPEHQAIDRSFFVANFSALNRESLRQYLTGTGVEIGPGHQPFIKHEDVTYLEKFALDSWTVANTAKDIDTSNWDKYLIGDAHNIPASLNDLQYIFSSHVFEHLRNPIGHLEHWFERLRPGGSVVAVVPAISGAKDLRATPSSLDFMLDQYATSEFELTLDDYRMYRDVHRIKASAEEMMDKEQSIHAHYFEAENTRQMLDYACSELGFRSSKLVYEPNHKDLHFVLTR